MSLSSVVGKVLASTVAYREIDSEGSTQSPSLVQLTMLISISTIALLKGYLMLIGVLDLLVGLYGLLVISMVFASFFFAYTKYEDPAKNGRLRKFSQGSDKQEDTPEHITGSGLGSPLMLLSSLAATPSAEPRVSMIIPVFNENDLIKGTVESCVKSRYPCEKLEIILVNDGSTDGTYEKLESIQQEYSSSGIKLVQLAENVGKRKAIREGINRGKASGDIIILVDSDCFIDEFAIQRLIESFSDPDVGAVTGHGLVKNADQNLLTKIQQTWYDGQFSILKGMESSFESVTCCSGILSAYRREALMPCLDSWCSDKFLGVEFKPGDDRHLTSFLLGGSHYYLGKEHKVWKVKYCESATTSTEVPSTLKKLLKQQTRWKKSWVRMFCFNLPFYFRYRPLSASYAYYLQTMLSFISPIVAFRSLVLLPMSGDFFNAIMYLSGMFFVACLYSVEFKRRNPDCGARWLSRLLLPILSLTLLNFVIYYSLLTIRSKSWLTR